MPSENVVLILFIITSHERRRIIRFNVTESPSAQWTGQQVIEAFPYDTADFFFINPTLTADRRPFTTVVFLPLLGFRYRQESALVNRVGQNDRMHSYNFDADDIFADYGEITFNYFHLLHIGCDGCFYLDTSGIIIMRPR